MSKLTVLVKLQIKADANDDEEIRQAVQDKLTELIEAEELEYEVEEEDFEYGED